MRADSLCHIFTHSTDLTTSTRVDWLNHNERVYQQHIHHYEKNYCAIIMEKVTYKLKTASKNVHVKIIGKSSCVHVSAWERANAACRKDSSLLRPPAAGWQGRQAEYANFKGPTPQPHKVVRASVRIPFPLKRASGTVRIPFAFESL